MDTKSKNRLKLSILFLLVFCIAAGMASGLMTRYIVRSIEDSTALSEDKALVDFFTKVWMTTPTCFITICA